jgi:hypothetical protein
LTTTSQPPTTFATSWEVRPSAFEQYHGATLAIGKGFAIPRPFFKGGSFDLGQNNAFDFTHATV